MLTTLTHGTLLDSDRFRVNPDKIITGLFIAGIVAIIIRLLVFIITAQYPIQADSGNLISPSLASGTDLSFYQDKKHEIASRSAGWLSTDNLVGSESSRRMDPGPLFPALLLVFKYHHGNSWPLAILFLTGSICLVLSWIKWLDEQGLSLSWLIAFALFPNTIYYMICVGTELPFSIIFAAFFFAYFQPQWTKRHIVTWATMLLLLLLTRPNAVSVALFVITDLIILRYCKGGLKKSGFYIILIAAALIFGARYYPYFVAVYEGALTKTFFGIPAYQYLEGIFPVLPEWMNRICSWLILILAKTLYFVGLRPSYSDVSTIYVLMRGLPGLLLLPGLIYVFWKGERRHQMLTAFFLLPILMVGAQDRYNMPIQPLLFFYGVKALSQVLSPSFKAKLNL